MALQFSTALRNAMLDAIETEGGTSVILEIRSGAQPANCAAASSGTLLASIALDLDWAAAAASGAKAFQGLPDSDISANATGAAAHFRLFKSDTTTCFMQGSVTATGGGGDLGIDNTSIVSGQVVQLSSWTITAPGA